MIADIYLTVTTLILKTVDTIDICVLQLLKPKPMDICNLPKILQKK